MGKQFSCWNLDSLETLLASWEKERRELEAALEHSTGRAWMMASWRASDLQQAGVRLQHAMTEPHWAHADQRGQAFVDAVEGRDRLSRLAVEAQERGDWHHAFCLRQHWATREDIRAALSCVVLGIGKKTEPEPDPTPEERQRIRSRRAAAETAAA